MKPRLTRELIEHILIEPDGRPARRGLSRRRVNQALAVLAVLALALGVLI
jgi:hypothetical protein